MHWYRAVGNGPELLGYLHGGGRVSGRCMGSGTIKAGVCGVLHWGSVGISIHVQRGRRYGFQHAMCVHGIASAVLSLGAPSQAAAPLALKGMLLTHRLINTPQTCTSNSLQNESGLHQLPPALFGHQPPRSG